MKLKKIVSTIIYILGCVCVAYFCMFAVIGGNHIENPNAMLPFTDFEIGTIILAFGCIPMVISSIALMSVFKFDTRIKKACVMIPSVITAVPFVGYTLFVIFLMFLGALNAVGIR